MADYKESTVSGTQWQRCWGVYIQNLYGTTPHVTLREEQVTVVSGATFQKDVGQIDFPFDPAATITLLNPETGEPFGATMTMGEMYVALWSLYMERAAARDAAAEAALAASAAEAEAANELTP